MNNVCLSAPLLAERGRQCARAWAGVDAFAAALPSVARTVVKAEVLILQQQQRTEEEMKKIKLWS